MCKVSSIVSRVVPAISDTIARSSFSKALSKVDLPALGFPTIATGIPFFKTFPTENDWISDDNVVLIVFKRVLN